jgi:hypothetical protein
MALQSPARFASELASGIAIEGRAVRMIVSHDSLLHEA